MKKHIYLYELMFMFLLGSLIYSLLEICFRGYTHWTMTVLGGIAAAALYIIALYTAPILIQALYGALVITAFELVTGVLVNIIFRMNVWDYSAVPFNLLGQICLPFTILWYIISLPSMLLCRLVREMFSYTIISQETAHGNIDF